MSTAPGQTPQHRVAAPPTANRTTDRFQVKREAILAVAAEEFNRHGLKGVTLASVAERVGLQKASVSYYHRRKEDLAADCMLQAIAAMQGVVQAALTQPSPAQRIHAFLRGQAALLADMATGRRGALVSFQEVRALAPPHGDRVAEAYNSLFRSLRQCLPSDPGWQHAHRNARTHLLQTLANGMHTWIDRYEPDDYGHAADALADLLLGGLAAQPQAWRAPAMPELPALRAAPAQADGSEVREAFLRAATALVNEQGFRGASVSAISARLHLTKGSFYHHHASKDELIAQCFARSFDVIRQTQLQAMAQTPSGWERLVTSTCALVRFQLSEAGPLLRSSARSALAEGARHDPIQRGNQLTERFGLFIVDGMREGAIRPVDASLAAQQVAAMVNAAASLRNWVGDVGVDDAVPLYAQPLFTGILTPP
ncbi:TetR/AcrR family transcriptional regulator [Comamonas serinivorans]|uniref:TetR/AcrR family transcriptional regulator n=1 Tax=Comamonas serinivorans TaxID=1082851 RepID=UPI00196A289A|nr:TetR/AcrR family transcriptional regulator [Comamonas serinivorans]